MTRAKRACSGRGRSVRGCWNWRRAISNRDPEATYSDPVQSIEFAIREWVRQNVRTCVPGIIRAYDARFMRARVQPALRAIVAQPDGSDDAMDRAPIYDVPVVWPGGGGFVFHSDLGAGDTVWLMFSERGIGEFKRTLALSDPPPMVMFESKDAVALPWRSSPITPAEGTTGGDLRDVVPTAVAGQSITTAQGATLQSADGEVYIQISDGEVKLKATNIILDGNVDVVGGLSNDGTNVGRFHRHTGVTTGTGVSGFVQ